MTTTKPQKLILILGLSAMTLGACHNIQYKNPSAQPGQQHSVKQSFFLWGLAGGEEINLKALCPAGVAEISSQTSIVDSLLGAFTGGLYSPRSVDITCQSGTAYRVEDDGEGTMQVAALPSTSN